MSKKKSNFFNLHKKQILIILAVVGLVCLILILLFPPYASTPSKKINTTKARTEEQIQQCMNAIYHNGFHPTHKTCEKYNISPDGDVIIDG